MARRHALVIASILGLAAVVAVVALGSTLGLGAASSSAQDAVVAKRTRQLDRFEASLRSQLAASNRQLTAAKRQLSAQQAAPPAQPAAVTRAAPVVRAAPAQPSASQRVVYVRPAPIIVHKHRANGEHETEHESGEDGGGFDD